MGTSKTKRSDLRRRPRYYGTGYELLQPDKENGGSTREVSDFAFQRI